MKRLNNKISFEEISCYPLKTHCIVRLKLFNQPSPINVRPRLCAIKLRIRFVLPAKRKTGHRKQHLIVEQQRRGPKVLSFDATILDTFPKSPRNPLVLPASVGHYSGV